MGEMEALEAELGDLGVEEAPSYLDEAAELPDVPSQLDSVEEVGEKAAKAEGQAV